jgi:THUMP domain-like
MPSHYLSQITTTAIQNFLKEHEDDNENDFVLKRKEIDGIPASMLATQLSGRKKAKTKLPFWYKTKGIVYPPSVNLEQCSGEATARFKAHLIGSNISNKGVAADITAGFGVDTFFLSSVFEAVHYAEPSEELFLLATHNHRQLGALNIVHHCLSAEKFFDLAIPCDLIYLDPSRRDASSRKVYKLADCSPDVSLLQHAIFKTTKNILLKASPLLDIQQGLRELHFVKKVFVISVGNECKELLFFAERGYEGAPVIEAVDLLGNGTVHSSFSFSFPNEKNASIKLGGPTTYLYEPNASIMKAGAFKLVAEKFGLTKLDLSTHLYTSPVVVPDFPGKVFLIECLDPDKKQLKTFLPEGQANVVTRNYPLSPDEIKKKLHLRDGGDKFLIGFSSSKKKHLAVCSRVTDI